MAGPPHDFAANERRLVRHGCCFFCPEARWVVDKLGREGRPLVLFRLVSLLQYLPPPRSPIFKTSLLASSSLHRVNNLISTSTCPHLGLTLPQTPCLRFDSSEPCPLANCPSRSRVPDLPINRIWVSREPNPISTAFRNFWYVLSACPIVAAHDSQRLSKSKLEDVQIRDSMEHPWL